MGGIPIVIGLEFGNGYVEFPYRSSESRKVHEAMMMDDDLMIVHDEEHTRPELVPQSSLIWLDRRRSTTMLSGLRIGKAIRGRGTHPSIAERIIWCIPLSQFGEQIFAGIYDDP